MKFKCDPKILREELSFLSPVSDKDESSIVSNLLIESVGKTALRISGTNLSTSVKSELDAEVSEEGTIAVSGKKLFAIMKGLNQEVSFTKDKNGWLGIKSGTAKYRLGGFDPKTFPTISILDKTLAEIDAATLSKMIKATSFAITTEESRYTLSGVKVQIKDGVVKMVSTDGHRISYIEMPCKGDVDFLIPKRALSEIAKLPKGTVEIGESNNQIYFKAGKRYLTTTKLAGTFPNYEMMFGTEDFMSLKVGTDDWREAIKRVSLMTDDRNRSMNFTFTPKEMSIQASTSDGESEDTIPIDFKGKDTKFTLNWTYLIDFLSNCDEKVLTVSFKDNTRPVHIGYDEGNYKYVLMPLRT